MTEGSEDSDDTEKKPEETEPTQSEDDTIDEDEEDTDLEEDDDSEEEPKLKYARLTSHLGPVYRNGDATSVFLVAGDKMVCSAQELQLMVLTATSSLAPITETL